MAQRWPDNGVVSILRMRSVLMNSNFLCCPDDITSDWQIAERQQHPHYAERVSVFYFWCLAYVFPDVSDVMYHLNRIMWTCFVIVPACSESAGGWCSLDAGHTDIFVAKVGMSHCMSMSPCVTPVWLLQEITQISPSAHRDRQRAGGSGVGRGNHFRDVMFSDNLEHISVCVCVCV